MRCLEDGCFGGPDIDLISNLGGWAPGAQPQRLAAGVGLCLPIPPLPLSPANVPSRIAQVAPVVAGVVERAGELTDDEMCLVFRGITFDRENLLPFSAPRQAR